MFLHHPPEGGLIPKSKFLGRFEALSRGSSMFWQQFPVVGVTPFWLKPFLVQNPCCYLTQGKFRVSFLLLFCKTSHHHATQRMAGSSGASGMVRSDPRPMSPRATQGVQQRQPVVPAHDQRGVVPVIAPHKPVAMQGPRNEISGGDSSECPGFYHQVGESSCVLGRVRRDFSRSPGRFSEASPVPGNSPCA